MGLLLQEADYNYSRGSAKCFGCSSEWRDPNLNVSSDLTLKTITLQRIKTYMGRLGLEMFAPRFSHQLTWCVWWKADLKNIVTDAYKRPWVRDVGIAFQHFILINCVSRKVLEKQIEHLVRATSTWKTLLLLHLNKLCFKKSFGEMDRTSSAHKISYLEIYNYNCFHRNKHSFYPN